MQVDEGIFGDLIDNWKENDDLRKDYAAEFSLCKAREHTATTVSHCVPDAR